MARLALQPSLVAPASTMASAVAASRMPPLALMPRRPPTVAAMRATAATDAPPVGWKPVDVFT